jgi:hypothetical protein
VAIAFDSPVVAELLAVGACKAHSPGIPVGTIGSNFPTKRRSADIA